MKFNPNLIVALWRNGSASDSGLEGWVFESHLGLFFIYEEFWKMSLSKIGQSRAPRITFLITNLQEKYQKILFYTIKNDFLV